MSDILYTLEEILQIVAQIGARFVDSVRYGEHTDLLEDCRAHEYGPNAYWRDEVIKAFKWLSESSR